MSSGRIGETKFIQAGKVLRSWQKEYLTSWWNFTAEDLTTTGIASRNCRRQRGIGYYIRRSSSTGAPPTDMSQNSSPIEHGSRPAAIATRRPRLAELLVDQLELSGSPRVT